MFSLDNSSENALNKSNPIYKEIATLAALRRNSAVLKYGRMYMRECSHDGKVFHLPVYHDCMLSFSRILHDEEILIVYNDSMTCDDEEYIMVDKNLNAEGGVFRYWYGGRGKSTY